MILTQNSISDGALIGQFLALTKARRADLSFNRLGRNGAIALAKELPNCKKLEELIVANNAIGDEGLRALVDGAKNLAAVRPLFYLSLFPPAPIPR